MIEILIIYDDFFAPFLPLWNKMPQFLGGILHGMACPSKIVFILLNIGGLLSVNG
jgi:hypothetical protein